MKKIMLIILTIFLVGCVNEVATEEVTKRNVSEYSTDMYNLKGGVKSFVQITSDLEYDSFEPIYLYEMGFFGSSNQVVYFDEEGNNIKAAEGTGYGSLVFEWTGEYDSFNRLVGSKIIFTDTKDYAVVEYETDDSGNLLVKDHIAQGKHSYFSNEELIEEKSISTTFDDKGRIIRNSNDTDFDGVEGLPYYDYNDLGYISDVYSFSEDVLAEHVSISYNDNGYMASYEFIVSDIEAYDLYEFEYIYDEKGNWVEQVVTVNNEKRYVVYRTYTYWNN